MSNQLQYPSTPKEFQAFYKLKDMKYEGNMLTSDERWALYWDGAKFIVEMVDSYNVFARCMFFNPEMSGTHRSNIDKYTNYFTSIVRNIDIYLQEDQLMCTKCGFPFLPIPTYLPKGHDLGDNTVCCIEDAANSEVKRMEQEMLNILDRPQDDSPHNMSNSSFSRLNDMGYGLNKISPITFDEEAFQTLNNRTEGRALTSTPRKIGKQSSSQADQQDPPRNNTYPGQEAAKQHDQPRSRSYDADTSVRNLGRFIPPTRPHPSDNNHSKSEDDTNQTVFWGQGTQKLTGTGTSKGQSSSAGMQTSPDIPAPAGITQKKHIDRWYPNITTSNT